MVAVLAGLFAVVLPTRSLRVAAAALGQLPVPLLSVLPRSAVDPPLALTATGLTAQTVAALALATAWPFGSRTRDARIVVAVGAPSSLVVASLAAGGAAYAEDGSLVVGTALLLVLAAVLAVAGTVAGRPPAYAAAVPVLDGGAAVLLVAAAWAPAYDVVPDRWLPAVLAADRRRPARRDPARPARPPHRARRGRARCRAAAGAGGGRAGDRAARGHARRAGPALAGSGGRRRRRQRPPGGARAAGRRRRADLAAWVLRIRHLAAVAVPVLAGAAVLAPPAFGAGYPLTLGVAVALAAALLVAGALLDTRGRVVLGWTALGTGAVLLALATAWSFAADVATLLTLPAAALALLAGATAARGAEALRAWRVALVTSALLLGVAEAAALARHEGAGWAAVWSLALGLLAMVAAAVAVAIALRTAAEDPFWAPLHSVAVAVAAAAVVADAAALAAWYDVAPAGCGLAAACRRRPLCSPSPRCRSTSAGRSAAWCRSWPLLPPYPPWRSPRWTATGSGSPCSRSGWASPSSPRRRHRHRLGWVAGVILAASSWVRLALSDVDAPEAYTVPGRCRAARGGRAAAPA